MTEANFRGLGRTCRGCEESIVYSIKSTKTPTVWLLVLSLAQLPVPWVHRHCDLKASELTPHLANYHKHLPELELGSGWHLHWLGRSTPTNGEGLQQQSPRDEVALDESQKVCVKEDAEVEWLSRINSRGQHATADLAGDISAGKPASAGYLRQFRGHLAQVVPDTCALFCVLLI